MDLVIINCSPRTVSKSNTERIIKNFREGFEKEGGTSRVYHLSERKTWDEIRDSFYKSDNVLLAMPLFVECVPGILMEFLESIEKENYGEGKKLSFLVQGGFPEASQLRCCEEYLEILPGYLNCLYGGTLIKGGMFTLCFMGEDTQKKIAAPFIEMGKNFANQGYFDKEKVTDFAGPEYFRKSFGIKFNLVFPLQKLMFKSMAKKLGCSESLGAKPYKKYIK